MPAADDPPCPPLLLASQPRCDAALEPLNETHEDDAHCGHCYDRHERPVHSEHVSVLDDQIAQADKTNQELSNDHPNQPAADGEADPGDDERRGRGQDHVGPEPPLAGVESAGHLQRPRSTLRTPCCVLMSTGKTQKSATAATRGASPWYLKMKPMSGMRATDGTE